MSYVEELFNLKNKVILVTGACGQLGSEICKAFSGTKSTVVGVDINIDNKKIKGVDYYKLDTTNVTDKKETYETIIKKNKTIDVIINNAGVSTFENFEQRTEEKFDWVVDVNLKSVFFDIQTYVNLFDKYNGNKGSIINIGSHYGVVSPDYRIYTDLPRKNSEVYGATKAGVIQMTKYFATHLAERNIRVNLNFDRMSAFGITVQDIVFAFSPFFRRYFFKISRIFVNVIFFVLNGFCNKHIIFFICD